MKIQGFWRRVLREDTEFQAVVTRRDVCLVPYERDQQRAEDRGREASITALPPSGRARSKEEGRRKSRECTLRPMVIELLLNSVSHPVRQALSRGPVSYESGA